MTWGVSTNCCLRICSRVDFLSRSGEPTPAFGGERLAAGEVRCDLPEATSMEEDLEAADETMIGDGVVLLNGDPCGVVDKPLGTLL